MRQRHVRPPLAVLFDQFLKERVYLKAISPRTEVWYRTVQGIPVVAW